MLSIRSAAVALALGSSLSLPALAQEANWKRDGNWITLDGLVTAASPEAFQLNYGTGKITVEMDDWDRWNEGLGIKAGDLVTVTGRVDRDIFETASIEANAVYVKNLNTYFYANPADEEDSTVAWGYDASQPGETTLRGQITVVNPTAGTFALNNGLATLTIDTSKLADDPLDARGSPQLEVGDSVYVIGAFDDSLFTKRALVATRLVKLKDATPPSAS